MGLTMLVVLMHVMPLPWPQAVACTRGNRRAPVQVDLCVMAVGALTVLPCLAAVSAHPWARAHPNQFVGC